MNGVRWIGCGLFCAYEKGLNSLAFGLDESVLNLKVRLRGALWTGQGTPRSPHGRAGNAREAGTPGQSGAQFRASQGFQWAGAAGQCVAGRLRDRVRHNGTGVERGG
jgi:hypothetical protein